MADGAEPELDLACHINVLVDSLSAPGFPDALAVIAGTGCRRVVLPPVDPATIDVGWLAETIASAQLAPITLAGQAPGADVSSDDPEERERGSAALRRMVDLTVQLGSDQMNGVPYGLFGAPQGPVSAVVRERSARAVGEVAEYAHDRGVTMTFEVLNRYETAMVNTAEQAMEFADASGSANLRIHLDTFHMAVEESDMAAAIRTALPRLAYLELGQSGRGSLAAGVVDVPRVVRGALDDGYTGRWGIEAFSRQVLGPEAGDMLAIWREVYADAPGLVEEAARVIASAESERSPTPGNGVDE